MGAFLEQLQKVWPLVSQAGWQFATLAAAIFFAGWLLGRFMSNERIETLKERIEAYKEKTGGATPEQASARIAELERRLDEAAYDPRLLKPDQLAKMAKALSGYPAGQLMVSRDAGSAESIKVQAQVVKFFKDQGWSVKTGATMGISNPPPSGIVLFCREPVALTINMPAVRAALDAGGVPYEMRFTKPHPQVEALQLNFSDAEDGFWPR
ncbi:MAG: hypothetical protein EOQ55_21070 [Mesorhizobium sp.]|uniref:hypothetical protein n=1 Tax=unclassified Mesorhizobium TaxID=325217 RepID=UPI000FCBFF88|nr:MULTISPECIES: hypothetical protein [unclassified Mesorhizobium]RUV40306.1 hypothetical protein EOD29_28895 [Mesorhizobium sp. M1A.T.Ca.IN.004.03.1.1]RWG16306.1 MAG: hypothetical protein EOQ55_21070 [Mesorhizobium sp.]RWI90073.1 MAG: hypothetical protein EOR21_24175 [Mesorhizobium sp.]RWK28427.1 MAG: hypothetical protein EOR40_28585 [Mesorhizobium sp.]RWK91881.1 MAG: hypothetical protein EOR52_01700 [Mesorhizobium sp.]